MSDQADNLPKDHAQGAPTATIEPAPAAGKAPAKAAPPKKERGPLFWLVVIIAAGAALVWTVKFVHRKLVYEETDNAYIIGHIHRVSPQLAGTVTDVLVEENQIVKREQLLARIDPLPSQIALQKAQAALSEQKAGIAQSEAALEQAKAEQAQAEAQVLSSEAQVDRITAQLDVAKINLNRNERLFREDQRTVAKADVDTTRSTADASTASLTGAKADAAAAKAKVSSAKASVDSAEAALTTAHAKVAAEEAAVRDAEREYSYVEIHAPANGRIGNKNVERGDRAQVGQAIFALIASDVWIVANFKETQLQHMQEGQPVEITVDAIGDRVFSGKIESVAPATGAQFALLPPDNATGNFTKVVQRVPVKIRFDADSVRGFENRLSPGMSTEVSVRIK